MSLPNPGPLQRLILPCALGLFLLLCWTPVACAAAGPEPESEEQGHEEPAPEVLITTVYIVRHAEKATGPDDDPRDPPLTQAGLERARHLAFVLADEGIDAVFVTCFRRTRQTGEPVAAAAGVAVQPYDARDTATLAKTLLSDHAGEQVLVVGHSDTVDDVANDLGAPDLEDLAADQYDRLFVVHRFGATAHLDRLQYGAPSP